MSLSRHLRDPRSPVRQWMADTLGATSTPVHEATRQLTGGGTRAPLAYRGQHPQLAGTALDLLARATLRPGALSATGPVRRGARVVVDPTRPTDALDVETAAIDRLDALGLAGAPADGSAWREAAALALVLAQLEHAARSIRAAQAVTAMLRTAPATVDGYRAALVDQADVEELARVAPSIADDLRDLRAATALHFDCEMAQSGPLGGAAPDLIADGALLDIKANSGSDVASARVIHQLCGYLLADTHDRYATTKVGLVAARWRRRHVWDAEELLGALARGPVDLAELRGEFAGVVARARTLRRRR